MTTLNDEAVLALAHQQGQAWVDEGVARRIAAGAGATVAAVQAALAAVPQDGLVATDPDAFLGVLESLADEPAP